MVSVITNSVLCLQFSQFTKFVFRCEIFLNLSWPYKTARSLLPLDMGDLEGKQFTFQFQLARRELENNITNTEEHNKMKKDVRRQVSIGTLISFKGFSPNFPSNNVNLSELINFYFFGNH